MDKTLTAADMADGHPFRFAAIRIPAAAPIARWIGCCKACKAAVRIEGVAVMAVERVWGYDSDAGPGSYRASPRGFALTAVLAGDTVYATRALNDHDLVLVRCAACPAFVYVRRVFDGGKPESKRHVCGARCTGATGPACDCKCRGANHGAGAGR